MNRRSEIIRFWVAVGILLLLTLGVITLVQRWHSLFPSGEVSSLYSRYADADGVEVAFAKDFRIGDGNCRVDVTLLKATTDSAWASLCLDMHIPHYPKDSNCFVAWLAPHDNYTLPMDTINPIANNDYLIASPMMQTISVFDIHTEEQLDAILNQKTQSLSKD